MICPKCGEVVIEAQHVSGLRMLLDLTEVKMGPRYSLHRGKAGTVPFATKEKWFSGYRKHDCKKGSNDGIQTATPGLFDD